MTLLLACWLLVLAATSAANLQQGWLVPGGQVKLTQQYFNSKDHKFVALTFDDGPDQHGYTLQVSDILTQYGVPGTFFLIGERAKAYPDQVKELVARGHEVGVHCYSHKQFPKLSAEKQRADIVKCQELLTSLGAEPHWFRPPYGEFSKTTTSTAAKLGLETILWTNDPRDWSQPGVETIIRRVLRDTTPGGVILLHSTNAQTVAALPAIIDQLAAKGYQFVTMSQWQTALSGHTVQAAPALVGESLAPVNAAGDLPRVIEQIEAQSPADHAQLLWGSIRSVGQDTLASHGLINWAQTAPSATVAPALEPCTVYSNFKTATDIAKVQARGGQTRMVAFVDELPTPDPSSRLAQAALVPVAPGNVVETQVQPGGELPALPVGEEIIIPPDAPAGEQAATAARPPVESESSPQHPTAVAPPVVIEIPPLEERKPLPVRSSDLVDIANPATAWHTPTGIDKRNFANLGSYSAPGGLFQEPNFYFLNVIGSLEDYTWVELETFVRLGRLKGMVLADEFTARPPTVDVSYPWTFYSMRWLDRGAVIDLTVEDTADVISALQRGKENVFIVVRPANLHFFIAAHLWAEMNYNMQDFVLLRQTTAGLSYDPAANLEEFWQLPQGVHLARFTDGQRTALVLYSKLRQPQTVEIPAQFAYYSQAQIDAGGYLRLEPLAARQVSVNYRPVVLYYEYGQS
jgi:peptidoglycan-N-acetylglucosamine deacetylase